MLQQIKPVTEHAMQSLQYGQRATKVLSTVCLFEKRLRVLLEVAAHQLHVEKGLEMLYPDLLQHSQPVPVYASQPCHTVTSHHSQDASHNEAIAHIL